MFDINVVLYEGVLRITEPLNYTSSHSHVLSVVATDCGGKKSAPVLVIVEVGRHQTVMFTLELYLKAVFQCSLNPSFQQM